LNTICIHCGEEIRQLDSDPSKTWYHFLEDGPDRAIYCDCHCASCDPIGGYTDGRACIDGEAAEPDEDDGRYDDPAKDYQPGGCCNLLPENMRGRVGEKQNG
jgi:hypothetical protein